MGGFLRRPDFGAAPQGERRSTYNRQIGPSQTRAFVWLNTPSRSSRRRVRKLEKLGDRLIARVIARVEALAVDPRPPGCKKLRGYKDCWRIRIGDYRVVYLIDDHQKIVSITRVAHRSDVY